MSFFDRFRKPKAEARSLENPAVPISDTAALMALFGISGGNLPAVTAEAALTVPAWASAVGFLSRTLANLPLHAYADKDGVPERIGGKLQRVFNEAPNAEWTSFSARQYLWSQVFASPAGRGLMYIERIGRNVDSLWPMDATQTTVRRVNGKKVYSYNGKDYAAADVIDVPFLLKADQLGSTAPLTMANKALALSIAMGDYAAGFFANGGVPPLQMVGPLASGAEAQKRALVDQKRAIEAAKNSDSQVVATAQGYELKPIGFEPDKGQMTEARKFQVEELARVLNLPPVFVGDLEHGTFSNTEQQDLQLVKHVVAHHAKALEEEINLKVFGAANNRRYVEHSLDGLQRGDFKARMDGLKSAVNTALLTPNEARALDNRPAKPGGDNLYIQGATVPLGTQPKDGPSKPSSDAITGGQSAEQPAG